MGILSVWFLVILYIMSGTIMAIMSYNDIKQKPYKRYFNIIQCMYVFVYSIVPVLVHSYCYANGNNEHAYAALDYSNNGIKLFYYSWAMSVIGYCGLRFGNKCVFGKRSSTINGGDSRQFTVGCSSKTWFIAATICLIVGIIAEMLWTKAYGGVVGIIEYSSALRSGWDTGITNKYTVFKRFVPLVQFANIVFWAQWVKNHKLSSLMMSVPAFAFSLMYLLANDGRAPLVMHIVALIWISLRLKEKKNSERGVPVVIVIFLGIVALFFMHNADSFISVYITKRSSELVLSFDLFKSIREEFAFTVRSGQAIFGYLDLHPLSFRFPLEVLSGILGILPSGFRPTGLEKLEVINTRYWVMGSQTSYYGGKPPDIIVTGIYLFGIIGVFLLPMILGKIMSSVDKKVLTVTKGFDSEVLFALVLYPLIRVVAYTNFDGITLSFFYIFLGYLILWFIRKLNKDDVLIVEEANDEE